MPHWPNAGCARVWFEGSSHMCGIVGVLGSGPVAGSIVDALKRLEYRGYDSAGVATLENGKLERRRPSASGFAGGRSSAPALSSCATCRDTASWLERPQDWSGFAFLRTSSKPSRQPNGGYWTSMNSNVAWLRFQSFWSRHPSNQLMHFLKRCAIVTSPRQTPQRRMFPRALVLPGP